MSGYGKWQQRKAAAGLCIECGHRPSGGFKRCAVCRAKIAAYVAALRAESERDGTCKDCGATRDDPRFKRCTCCREKGRARVAKSKARLLAKRRFWVDFAEREAS